MNMNQFFQSLTSTVAGGAERRFAHDLARELGIRLPAPEHGGKPKATGKPAPTPGTPQPESPVSAGFTAGQEHGKSWGVGRAYISDLQRLIDWASTVRGEFTGADVAAAVFPHPVGEWSKHDADRLLAGDVDYARGFVVGAMLVWAEQLTKHQKAKEG